MDFECIRYITQDQTALITLNRPQVLNAMNRRMWRELESAFQNAENDPNVAAVIVTGAGRAFSTGADLKESRDRSLADYRAYLEALQETSRRIIRFEKATIAAINGYALGSGYELALACDIRLAAENAQIGSPEARVSSSVTGGALRLVQELIGTGKAKELMFTGRNIDGREAERIGLVNQALAPDQLMAAARQMAAEIAENSAFSIKLIKRGLRMAQGEASLEAIMDYEVEACLACVSTDLRQQALRRFQTRKEE